MSWAPVYPNGRSASALASVGTVGKTARVCTAGAETFEIAGILRFRASATTADISNTWWLRSKRS
jgi:hypothetical protein